MSTRWQDIPPADATNLNLAVRTDITAPLNENGERCPWPWEPQQMGDAPLGQYHCPYCGAMVLAGTPHLDYSPTAHPLIGKRVTVTTARADSTDTCLHPVPVARPRRAGGSRPVTYDNTHPDRRRYGNRADEPCGSWRGHGPPVKDPGDGRGTRRAVCTRRHHPGDPLHHTADRQWWWTATDRHPRPATDTGWQDITRQTTPAGVLTTQPGLTTDGGTMTTKTIGQLTAEIREINTTKGWRAADGPGDNTRGDYIALIHSELSEALEAYRDHRLADATEDRSGCHRVGEMCAVHDRHIMQCAELPKPEGVGSELADTTIRLLDMGDIFGFRVADPDLALADIAPAGVGSHIVSFGDWIALLHDKVTDMWNRPALADVVLRYLVAMADQYGIDLTFEVDRKVAFNRTRPYQHGGRTLSGDRT